MEVCRAGEGKTQNDFEVDEAPRAEIIEKSLSVAKGLAWVGRHLLLTLHGGLSERTRAVPLCSPVPTLPLTHRASERASECSGQDTAMCNDCTSLLTRVVNK